MESSLLDKIVSVTDLAHGKAGQVVDRVGVGEPVIIMRRSIPAAVMITPEEYREYERLRQQAEDASDLALANERLARWDGNPDKLLGSENVWAKYNIADEEL